MPKLPLVRVKEKRTVKLLIEYKRYVVRFEGFEVKTGQQYGDTVTYKYTVMNGKTEDGESAKGAIHLQMFGADCRVGSKLYDHICQLLNVDNLEEDEDVDLNPKIGKYYYAIFSHKPDKKDKSKIYNEIQKLEKYVSKKK